MYLYGRVSSFFIIIILTWSLSLHSITLQLCFNINASHLYGSIHGKDVGRTRSGSNIVLEMSISSRDPVDICEENVIYIVCLGPTLDQLQLLPSLVMNISLLPLCSVLPSPARLTHFLRRCPLSSLGTLTPTQFVHLSQQILTFL